MEKKHSAGFLRKRKMIMMLPVLVFPFITMAFWALGGGRHKGDNDLVNAGLNLQLPDANLKDDKNADKLSFYKEADTDSLKKDETLRNDPFYKDSLNGYGSVKSPGADDLFSGGSVYSGLNYSPYNGSTSGNEKRIYQKINELNRQINQPDQSNTNYSDANSGLLQNGQPQHFSNDVNRLQDMMEMMTNKQDDDPEMNQLNGTLEKILDIQHPDRVKEKLKERSLKSKEQVFVLTKQPEKNNISLLDSGKEAKAVLQSGFYSLEEDQPEEEQNTVEAVVHQTQTLVNGSVVKMRLQNDIYINGSLVPKGNFIFGTAQLNNERLEIAVNSIRSNNSLFTVKLDVFDMDGLPGIYIPGAISRDVAKQSADNSLQLLELSSMDPSFKAQATATGINAAKNLFSRKVKLVKVQVKAGYRILLRDNSIQQ